LPANGGGASTFSILSDDPPEIYDDFEKLLRRKK